MVEGETNPVVSGSEGTDLATSEKSLLHFYQRKFDEYQKQDDKYKQKIDKHLSDLIADRHELEAEVLRRGEKITNLQKALVDLQLSCFEERERFLKVSAEKDELKKNEKKLHENIRQVLNVTQEKDLRDKIIYVLKDPKVEIGYRSEDSGCGIEISSSPTPETLVNKYLKDQVKSLQSQLDEYIRLSKTKADVVLEDCKRALESSRERIKQDEEENRRLRLKLQKLETEVLENQQKLAKKKDKEENGVVSNVQKEPLSSRSSRGKSSGSTESVSDVASCFREMHLTLILLSKMLSKLKSILNNIHNTKIFLKTLDSSQIPPSSLPDYAENTDIVQLETYARQCTRLTFDVNSMQETLVNKYFSKQSRGAEKIESIVPNLLLDNLKDVLRDLATLTAEADLVVLDLNRSKFFEHLQCAPGKKRTDESPSRGFKYATEFKKLINTYKHVGGSISKAISLTEKALSKCEVSDFVEVIDVPGTSYTAEKRKVEPKLVRNLSSEWVIKEALPLKSFEVMKEKKVPKQLQNNGRNLDKVESRSKSANFSCSHSQTKRDKESRNSTPECFEVSEELTNAASDFPRQNVKGMYVNLPSEHCYELKSQAFPTTQLRAEDKEFKRSKACGQKAKTETSEDLEKLIKIYKNTISEAEDLGLGSKSELKSISSKLKLTEELLQLEQIEECKESEDRTTVSAQQTQNVPTTRSLSDDVIKQINRTLAKVKQVESKECLQDEELCKNLEEKINSLAKKLKELSEEFSIKNLHEQFSEYSSVTMNKLETLAKQTRDSLSAAEAQIGTYKANVQLLSQKLKDTEELLRESVNECLSLKQKLKSEEEKREKQKIAFYSELKEKVSQVAEIEELEKILDDVMSSEVLVSKDRRRPSGPYECMYCKQGPGHKVCEEKIKDLRANNRKLSTEIKLVQQELKEEKIYSSSELKQAEKAIRELTAERNTLKDSAQSLESKCSSLAEQLKVERNKTKNMERYRKLEIEGFQTDIKNLKTKIRDIEKQLMKAVLVFEQDNKDLELLKTVHSTAQRSRQAVANIKRLKAKLYELETDIKNI